MKTITQAELKERLSYNENTGVFTWIKTPPCNSMYLGEKAGSKHIDGYWHISIDGTHYLAHRLAWLYVHGSFPNEFIDHKNGIRNDNRMCNLREASRLQNNSNRKLNKNNKTGFKGVSKRGNMWRVRIRKNGNLLNIGSYPRIELAIAAYQNKANQLFGVFQR